MSDLSSLSNCRPPSCKGTRVQGLALQPSSTSPQLCSVLGCKASWDSDASCWLCCLRAALSLDAQGLGGREAQTGPT